MPAQKEVESVPICEKYKYLGTILTPKLTSGEQIAHISKKSTHIFVKLYPHLQNATAEARRDMWQTMVRPLFDATFVLLEYEPSITNKGNYGEEQFQPSRKPLKRIIIQKKGGLGRLKINFLFNLAQKRFS